MTLMPEPVQNVLRLYRSFVQDRLPNCVTDFYLYGSLALGAYEHGFSDIDFVAVLNEKASEEECDVLRGIHKDVVAQCAQPIMMGSYLQLDDLGRLPEDIQPAPFYYQGQFRNAGQCDLNLVTWWVLKHKGISVWGRPSHALPFDVDWDILMQRMAENLHSYWGALIARIKKNPETIDDDMVQWSVLGILRLFYSFREGDIISKIGAGKYGLEVLPESWHRILNESIRIRLNEKEPLYVLTDERTKETLGFMDAAFSLCVEEIEKLGLN